MSPHHPGPSPSLTASSNISTTMSVTETSRPVAGSHLPPPQTYITENRGRGPLDLPPPSSLAYISSVPSMGRSRAPDSYHHEQYTPRTTVPVDPYPSYEAQRRSSVSLQHILQDVPEHPRASASSTIAHPVITSPIDERERSFAPPYQPISTSSVQQRRQARNISQRREENKPEAQALPTAIPPLHTSPQYSSLQHTPSVNTSPQYPSPQHIYTPSNTSEAHQDTPEPRSRTGSRTMQISGLISDSSSNTDDRYAIRVRQQPLAARACGFGERDRRVIDPPPIVQLTLTNPSLTQEQIIRKLRSPFSVIHCTLWNATTDEDKTTMPGVTDRRPQRRLMGTLVASPFVGRDENDEEGCFFCFPDLSCRTHGSYRLKFQLVILDPNKFQSGSSFPILSTTMSEPFQVFNAKDFPGMRASTSLTKKLKEQGCLISVKKGNDKHTAAREDTPEEEEPEGDDSASSRARGKRPKR